MTYISHGTECTDAELVCLFSIHDTDGNVAPVPEICIMSLFRDPGYTGPLCQADRGFALSRLVQGHHSNCWPR